MVFVDGELLTAVGWEGEVKTNSYFIDYDAGQIYLGVNPTNHLIEITAFDSALTRTTGKVHGKISDAKGRRFAASPSPNTPIGRSKLKARNLSGFPTPPLTAKMSPTRRWRM